MTAAVLPMQGRPTASISKSQKSGKARKAQLPAIAPRYQLLSNKSDPTIIANVDVPRTRLPPRSRFGCWTCRTRKVKCDEARPECTPCSRLGHPCDYNPRLSFKNDTPRVVEKMAGVAGSGGPVWDPSLPRPFKRRRVCQQQEDLLPPFSMLTNDEDRERKAEFRTPGSYYLVVNPSSFAEFDEYKDNQHDRDSPKSIASKPRGSEYADQFSSNQTRYDEPDGDHFHDTPISKDSDIVILKTFEDDTHKLGSPTSAVVQALSSRTSTLSLPSSAGSTHRTDFFMFSYDNTPLMRMAHHDGRDHQLVYYYKTFVYRHLAQVHRDSLGTSLETGALSAPDIFERQAASFLPLYHALMAFCALSMSYKNGVANLDALQHYQQALPSLQYSLRSEQDLTSDGVFLTHFILLLYEIAAGEPRTLSLWPQHIDQLLRITLLRREMYGHEPYSFIVWWVASIDTHVVLSGMGNGEFVETMLRRNILASGMSSQNPYHANGYNPPSRGLASPNGYGALPSALAFHRRISILAAELGLLARDIRAEEKQHPDDKSHAVVQSRHERIGMLQDTLRGAWNAQMPVSVANGYCNQILPVGARGIFEHAKILDSPVGRLCHLLLYGIVDPNNVRKSFALYRACLIYSHSSMYSMQRLLSPSSFIHEVSQCGGEILQLAREIVSHNHLERKFIVFPLFMSGFVSETRDERMEILALMKKMEEDTVGRNGVAARQLLEIVYDRQDRRKEELRREGVEGGREDVDWVSMIAELGLQVVNCRL